jgi:hypothetical protein
VRRFIPDYTLSPNTDYNGMAKQIAVIQWTKDSISKFNGNPNGVLSPDIQEDTWAHWPL